MMVETVVKLSVTTVLRITLYPVTSVLLSVHVMVMEEDEFSKVREDGELGGKFCLSQIKESGL